MALKLNEFAQEVHRNAVEHGWWEEEPSFGDVIALCHAELSEALEEYRAGRPNVWKSCQTGADICMQKGCGDWRDGVCELDALGKKPEGIAVELADCMLRILDWCGKNNIDIEAILREKQEYNKTRPYRHGGKAL